MQYICMLRVCVCAVVGPRRGSEEAADEDEREREREMERRDMDLEEATRPRISFFAGFVVVRDARFLFLIYILPSFRGYIFLWYWCGE